MISLSNKKQDISAEAFAQFLARLSDDPNQAGEAYEEQRQILIKFFECRGIAFADELADEVLNRVMRRLHEGEEIQNLDSYCFSIARFLLMERSRSPEKGRVDLEDAPPLSAPEKRDDNEDARLECLRKCLQAVPAENRDLIMEYYQDEKRAKIDVRQAIAARLGITRNALTHRMVRLRQQLEKCITRCAKNTSARIRKN